MAFPACATTPVTTYEYDPIGNRSWTVDPLAKTAMTMNKTAAPCSINSLEGTIGHFGGSMGAREES